METIEITWGSERCTMTWDGSQAAAPIRVDGAATQWQTADARHRLPLAVALACSVVWPEGDWPSMPATAAPLDPSWADGSEAWEEMEYEVVGAEEAQSDYHCGCGEWMGEWCAWNGPLSDMVVVEYLPEWVRSSHAAARSSGSWPRNGAVRVAVERSCADRLLESEGDPNDWPDGCTWAAVIDADPRDYADAEEAQR